MVKRVLDLRQKEKWREGKYLEGDWASHQED
jgi:hypothetical protein